MPVMATAVAHDEDWAKAVDDQEGNKLSNQVRQTVSAHMPGPMAMQLRSTPVSDRIPGPKRERHLPFTVFVLRHTLQ